MNLSVGWCEAWSVVAPITCLRSTYHKAKRRVHICSECFTSIHIGERYSCTVYKDEQSGRLAQYKVHGDGCPYPEEWNR